MRDLYADTKNIFNTYDADWVYNNPDLTFRGEDENGNPFWTNENGKKYYIGRPAGDDMGPGGRDSETSGGSPGAKPYDYTSFDYATGGYGPGKYGPGNYGPGNYGPQGMGLGSGAPAVASIDCGITGTSVTGTWAGAQNGAFMQQQPGGFCGSPGSYDIPQSSGPEKYSQQSIQTTAMANPRVRNAISSGMTVVLQRNNTVGCFPVSKSVVLNRGIPGGDVYLVSFRGGLNSDGSLISGQPVEFAYPGLPGTSDKTLVVAAGAGMKRTGGSGAGGGYGMGTGGGGCDCDMPPAADNLLAVNTSANALQYADEVMDTSIAVNSGQRCDEPVEDDVYDKSYLWVVDKDGKKPDKFATDFFENILNPLAGGVFSMDPETGALTPDHGMDKKNDSTKPNKNELKSNINKLPNHDTEISKKLAKTIFNGIYANDSGKDDNEVEAQNKPILLRIIEDDDTNTEGDSFPTGLVDLTDFKNFLNDVNNKMKSILPANIEDDYNRKIIQASFCGHVIKERCSLKNYEDRKSIRIAFATPHYNGGVRGAEIIAEMTNFDFNPKNMGDVRDNNNFYKYQFPAFERDMFGNIKSKPVFEIWVDTTHINSSTGALEDDGAIIHGAILFRHK